MLRYLLYVLFLLNIINTSMKIGEINQRVFMMATDITKINREKDNQSSKDQKVKFVFEVSRRSITLPFCTNSSTHQDLIYKSECVQIDSTGTRVVKIKI